MNLGPVVETGGQVFDRTSGNGGEYCRGDIGGGRAASEFPDVLQHPVDSNSGANFGNDTVVGAVQAECHITASVFINDDESGLHHDYDVWLEKLAPHAPVDQYRHNVGEDNADAHMKRQIMGREVVVAVTEGRLDFGTWERIFYGEFDGRRRKRVLVKIIGD